MFVSFSFPAPRCKGNISPLSLPKSVGAHKQCSAAAPHRHYNLSVLGANLFSITAPRIYIRLISCLLQKPKVHKYRPMSLSKVLHAVRMFCCCFVSKPSNNHEYAFSPSMPPLPDQKHIYTITVSIRKQTMSLDVPPLLCIKPHYHGLMSLSTENPTIAIFI